MRSRRGNPISSNARPSSRSEPPSTAASDPGPLLVELVFMPGERYRLVDVEAVELTTGYAFDVEGTTYAVARIGRSPLPGDERRCAYLVRGRDGLSEAGGNS